MTVARRAPFGTGALDAALLPFGEGTMLPAEAYTSAEVFAWEQRHYFAGTWMCLGRPDELRGRSGSSSGTTQRALTVGDVPVLLLWDRSGEVAAFANTCRHRGHELLGTGQSSSRRAVVCPYHAWSYALDGSLLAAPGFHDVGSFDAAAHGLVRLPLEQRHGWVFVNATGDAPSFAEHLGALPDLLEPYAPERLVRGAVHDYVLAANWKVITENYHECYHCPLIHPELCQVSPPTSGANYDLPGAWVGGSMDLRDGAQTMSLDGRSNGAPIPGADPRQVRYLGLLPNLLVSLHPDYVMTHRMTPLAADRTQVQCSWYFVPREDGEEVDPSYAVEFWDLTNRQDWAACESVQRGLASPHFRPGPLAPSEDAVHQFVTMVARGYLDGDLRAASAVASGPLGGACPGVPTLGGMTPTPDDDVIAFAHQMFDLARDGAADQLAAYVDAGLPVNLTNDKGDTLLILAAYYGRPEAVEALLARGADHARVNDRGQSALAAAVFKQSLPAVQALLAAGADPAVGSPSALDTARFFDLPQLVELLQSPR
jgi:Rieske 2Fe-2S family protein